MNKWIVLLLTVCLLPVSACGKQARPEVDEAALHDSLKLYEGYLTTVQEPDGSYPVQQGHPMYLYSFGALYLYLWEVEGDDYYRDRLIAALDQIETLAEPDWTWLRPNGAKSSLYNYLFSELFLDSSRALDDPALMETCGYIVGGLKDDQLFHAGGNYGPIANVNMVSYFAIERYLAAAQVTDEELSTISRLSYDYAMTMYDEETNRWYYNANETGAEFYDGHSAYYQMLLAQIFLDYLPDIGSGSTPRVQYLEEQLPAMIDPLVIDHLNPTGTFYYLTSVTDYTESAATVLFGLELFDQHFGTDHIDQKAAAASTILSRQTPDGLYYGSQDESVTGLWWGDEIAAYGSKYLRLKQ